VLPRPLTERSKHKTFAVDEKETFNQRRRSMMDRRLEEEVDAVFRKKGKEESRQMGRENKSKLSPMRGGASRHSGHAKEVCGRMMSNAVKRRAAKKRLGRDRVKEKELEISGVTQRRRE
jgi:hypothetical protein